MGGVWERMFGVSRKILDSMLLREGSKTLTYEVLYILLLEVTAIVNARPLVPVSTDLESPCVLCPAMLLTYKTNQYNVSFPSFGNKDMLKSQWKHTQFLAEEFWNCCNEYLNRLKTRQKWTCENSNMKEGDLELLRDHECARNNWPVAIVEKTFPIGDQKVRKVQNRVVRDGKAVSYVRPINNPVMLVEHVELKESEID
ncbi:uncharacterized protein [Mytilus edulis]|uniref:uncharacterized protein n=1 Tax=Mytilus edulis TaxID=6550 RepID=UPI0039EE6AB7